MRTGAGKGPIEKGILDTLGQNRTKGGQKPEKRALDLRGTGSDLLKGNALDWPKRKQMTSIVALNLVTVAEKKGRSERYIKQYWKAYHCLEEVTTSDHKLYGIYCKTRICTVCNAIRKAELITKYLPIAKTWPDPHFVTLTVPAIKADKLNRYMQDLMIRGFKEIIEKYRKPSERGTGKKLMGLRSLECCFNPSKQTYNPHFHVLVPDKETGEILIKEWLIKWRRVKAKRAAQDIRPVEETERDMSETIKYGTKMLTDPEAKKFKGKKRDPFIYVSAIDNILYSMRRKRLVEHFGFKVPKCTKLRISHKATNYEYWKFNKENCDWVSFEDESNVLCGYRLSSKLRGILANNINLDLQ